MPEQPERYRVDASALTKASLRRMLERATAEGLGEQAAEAAHIIIERLQTDPLIFGEPVHQLRHLKLEMRLAVKSPVSVEYGVDAERRIVYIRHFSLSVQPKP